jgi:hypothetical protein
MFGIDERHAPDSVDDFIGIRTERKLWSRIRNNQLEVNFRRQHAIGNYIPDFCSPKAKLGIKLDGLQAKVNALRERWLSSLDSSSLRAGLGRVRGVMPFAGSVA